ncbi:MAG: cobalamin biosynthesis protein CbiA [Desulfobacterales bacterium]
MDKLSGGVAATLKWTMEIDLEGLVVIVGNYGSGKTEIAVNLAVERRRRGLEVRLADLDLVNPYFRTRDARQALRRIGIEVLLPPAEYLYADLPILSPSIAGMIRRPGQLDLIDAGGDPVGARALSTLAAAFDKIPYRMLQVVNPLRPETSSVSGCLKLRREIEVAARLRVTGWIGNANLIDETTPQDILRGYEFMRQLAAESELPLTFITAAVDLQPHIDWKRLECPVLTIARQLVPPWKNAAAIS